MSLSSEVRTLLKFYTITETCKLLRISYPAFQYAVRSGQVLPPTNVLPFSRGNRRRYYDSTDIEKLRQFFVPDLITQRKAASLVGLHHRFFWEQIQLGRLPAPTHGTGKRKYYCSDDIAVMKIELAKPRRSWWDKVRAQGFYNQSHAAKMLEVPLITFQLWRAKDWLPAPSHLVGTVYCYSLPEIEKMSELVKKRRVSKKQS